MVEPEVAVGVGKQEVWRREFDFIRWLRMGVDLNGPVFAQFIVRSDDSFDVDINRSQAIGGRRRRR